MADLLAMRERVDTAHRRTTKMLAEAGIDTAALDARLLIQHAAGLTHENFIARGADPLDAGAAARLDELAARRAAREPVARIIGVKEFWGREFLVAPDTLVPRPDSEVLIEAGLVCLRKKRGAPRIADLGTGTGCLLVSLLAEVPAASGIGVDCAEAALACARANAVRHGVGDRAVFMRGDWADGLEPGTFDLIVANPPYIPSRDIAGLAPEVARFDPRAALDGGADGLTAVCSIANDAARVLQPGGVLLMEVGQGQSGDAIVILSQAGLDCSPQRDEIADLAGVARVVKAVNGH